MIFRFYILSVIIFLLTSCATMDKRGKTPILNKTIEDIYLSKTSDYKNTVMLKDVKGNLYVLNETGEYKQVMIKWDNGFTSLGIINNNNKEAGKWYLYDKKNRLIKRVVYSENGNSILTIDKFNRKGELIDRNSYSVSF